MVHAQKLPRCKAEQGFKRGILLSMLSAEAAATTQQMGIFQRQLNDNSACNRMPRMLKHKTTQLRNIRESVHCNRFFKPYINLCHLSRFNGLRVALNNFYGCRVKPPVYLFYLAPYFLCGALECYRYAQLVFFIHHPEDIGAD